MVGDLTIGYANCPGCGFSMCRKAAKIHERAVLVEWECARSSCPPVTCALTTEDDEPMRLEWFFQTLDKWEPPASSPTERSRRR
jgi:hypothetical protein